MHLFFRKIKSEEEEETCTSCCGRIPTLSMVIALIQSSKTDEKPPTSAGGGLVLAETRVFCSNDVVHCIVVYLLNHIYIFTPPAS